MKPKRWQEFETEVAQIYVDLGFKVTPNVLISGQQVDILAEKSIPGAGIVRLAIECKFRTNGNVPNQEVYDYLAFVKSQDRSEITQGVMVTNRGYSNQAKAAGTSDSILTLETTKNLRRGVFPVDGPLQSYVTSYQEDDIFDNFISLDAISSGKRRLDALQAVTDHALEGTGSLAVLGDFGSGKTTLLERVRFNLAKSFLRSETERIPIFYRLREMLSFPDFDTFIIETFHKNFMFRPSMTEIQQRMRAGVICSLFDGFDEIGVLDTEARRFENLERLYEFAGISSSAIISSRPTYFLRRTEYRKIFEKVAKPVQQSNPMLASKSAHANVDFINQYLENSQLVRTGEQALDVLELKALTKADIKKHLKSLGKEFERNLGTTWEEVYKFLFSIYDLGDLMKRPILLRMVVDTVMLGHIAVGEKKRRYGPYQLYELYTWASFCRETDKSRVKATLTPELRQLFAQAISIHMLSTGTILVSSEDIQAILHQTAADILPRSKNLTVGEIVTDLRASSFLEFADDRSFRFAHRSFMEFFCAQAFCNSLKSPNDSAFSKLSITREVIYFASSYIDENVNLQRHCAKLERELDSRSLLRQHLVTVMTVVGGRFKNLVVAGVTIPDSKIANQVVDNFVFDKVRFEGCEICDVKFIQCRFSSTRFSGGEFERVSLNKATGSLSFAHCSISDVQMSNCNIQLSMQASDVRRSAIRGGCIRPSAGLRTFECTFTGVLFRIPRFTGKSFSYMNSAVKMRQCTVEYEKVSDISTEGKKPLVRLVNGSRLDGCYFAGTRLSFDGDGGPGLLDGRSPKLADCSGLIFVNSVASRDVLRTIRETNPMLIVVLEDLVEGSGEEARKEVERIKERLAEIVSSVNDNQKVSFLKNCVAELSWVHDKRSKARKS